MKSRRSTLPPPNIPCECCEAMLVWCRSEIEEWERRRANTERMNGYIDGCISQLQKLESLLLDAKK